ncbi:MAG: Npun_F0494 family protein [Microcystaceae cyanobacterium]
MTSTQNNQLIQYSNRTLKRADRALCCSPFQLALFTAMGSASVPLPIMAGQMGQAQGYTQKPLSERRVEKDLLWLIDVGLLRREVDGQGITDSFRLTPLGRQLVEKWEHQGGNLPTPSRLERLFNTLNRWIRLPI